MYRLWLRDVNCGVAADRDATNWLDVMQNRGYEGVRMEPDPDAVPTFPLSDDDSEEPDVTTAIATVRCTHCKPLSRSQDLIRCWPSPVRNAGQASSSPCLSNRSEREFCFAASLNR